MAYLPQFELWAVGRPDAASIRLARRALFHLCLALVKIDYDYLREFPTTPKLYNSGVIYKDDTHIECWKDVCQTKEDYWQDLPTTYQKGYGDCEDLACILVAELWMEGIHALPFPRLQDSAEGEQLWHIQVLLPDGMIEDPSAKLGMPTLEPVTKGVFGSPPGRRVA
jgi:hypothetical protein